MDDISIWGLGCLFIFAFLVFLIIIPVVIARWIFRVNEQILLLHQILQELFKLNGKKSEVEK